MKMKTSFQPARRSALRGLASTPAIAVGAAAAVALPIGAEPVVAELTPDTKPKGYQDTKHVRDYYRTAGF